MSMSRSARRKLRASHQAAPLPQDTVNLLIGKVFTSNVGSTQSFPLSNINDQDASTRWVSTSVDNVTVATDLGAAYRLSRLRLVWQGDCTKNYRVELSPDNDVWTTIYTGVTTNNPAMLAEDHAITLSNLPAGRYFRIVCVDRWYPDYGNSLREAEAYGSAATLPNPPRTMRYSSLTDTGVTLAWDPPTDANNTTYNVYRVTGTTFSKYNTSPVTSTTYPITTLFPGTDYTFAVKAVTGGMESTEATTSFKTTGTAPAGIFSTNAASPTKVMMVGDSITCGLYGSSGTGIERAGFRQLLWKDIKNTTNWQTVAVGRLSDMQPATGETYTVGSFVDSNHIMHSGFGGWDVNDIAGTCSYNNDKNNPPYYDPSFGNINNWIVDYAPDIILLEAGTNDYTKWRVSSTQESLNNLTNLIQMIFTASPSVILFVSNLPPIASYKVPSSALYNDYPNFNPGVPPIVQSFKNAGKRIYYADICSGLDLAVDIADGVHPNNTGYAKMAVRWKEVLTAAQNGTL